jgi:UDPglucose--hexose-1-phosphate uridylyltransferase
MGLHVGGWGRSAVKALPRHELRHDDGRRVLVYGALADGARLDRTASTDVEGIHMRFDLGSAEWVAISPARNVRPLDSADVSRETACPICPGNIELPFSYEAAVFENRFPSFVADPPAPSANPLAARSRGRCEVVVYTPRHEVSFGALSVEEMGRLLAIWTDRSNELWSDDAHELVLIFENRGAEAGATLAHPHGQIYAFDRLPPITAAKARAHASYRKEHGACLGCALVDGSAERTVVRNESFAVAVPYAPRWPYEVAVRARRHGVGRLGDLAPGEQVDLANALRDVALRYDALFESASPYLMVLQEAPSMQPDWHFAVEFFPLHRTKEKTKIRASVETATGMFLNDVLPEDAARSLAALSAEAQPLNASHLFGVDRMGQG